MKKIILIILTALVSLFIFNYNVEALNSDATATCVYSFPSNNFYSGATIIYKNGEVTSNSKCNLDVKSGGKIGSIDASNFEYSCEINVLRDYFINDKTEAVECPKLYYYYKVTDAFAIWKDGNFTDFIDSDILNSIFKVLDKSSYKNLSKTEQKNATIVEISPTAGSTLSQGSKPLTEAEEAKYLQCQCGDVLIKNGQILFDDSVLKWYAQTYKSGFNPKTLKSCPEGIYYRSYAGKRTIEISDGNFEKAQALSCSSTSDIEKYSNSSSNDTDYKPQEDVIKSFCEETHGVWKMAGYLINALKVMIPVIIIVMGSIDLGKAVVANSEDEMKKATQVLIKRVIAGIIIFFIPTIMNLILKMASNYVSTISSSSSCIECVTKPWGC